MNSNCPLCNRNYAQLSQHLRITHKDINVKERKLILSLESGRVSYREGTCRIPGCGKTSSRLDRHILGHTELSKRAQRDAIRDIKRQKVIDQLAALRATCPAIPMATFLDIDEIQNFSDDREVELSDQEEYQTCAEEKYQRVRAKLMKENADLNKQNDILATTLKEVTKRYKRLKRRTASLPSSQVCSAAKKLLSTLEPEIEGEPSAQPSEEPASVSASPLASTSQREPQDELPYYPEHVVALNDDLVNEYKSHQEGSDPSAKLKNNVASKVFRIKHFLGYMAEGKSTLGNMLFLNDTPKIRQWMDKLRASRITETTIHHYLKNVAQFLDYVSETPPATCRLSKAIMVGVRREVRNLIRGMRRKVVTHEYAVKMAKEGKLLSKAHLIECREKARKLIPAILEELKKSPTSRDQWRFYGHLTAYLATIYGHRGGVFQNMLVEEVASACKTDPAGNILINAAEHRELFEAALLHTDSTPEVAGIAKKDRIKPGSKRRARSSKITKSRRESDEEESSEEPEEESDDDEPPPSAQKRQKHKMPVFSPIKTRQRLQVCLSPLKLDKGPRKTVAQKLVDRAKLRLTSPQKSFNPKKASDS
ncbi:hypothetical protein E1301_Tti021724 [Triplophysa tibetana]|uniref:Uncharacterized protein n=1 Tax=Triplophysa tibetana TaxID=1572043 RepID=A0A5A9NAP9_9TELE|nr:hypothetical protein E1301_Tti021724 [Triplophysa tibetana]